MTVTTQQEETAPGVRTKRRKKGRTGKIVGAGVAVLAVGAATAATLGFGFRPDKTADNQAQLPPTTAKVTKQTLNDTQSVSGTLGYGDSTTLISRLQGTVTSLPYASSVFQRGNTVYKLDNTPVVLMYGNVPAYRPLKVGDEGADVKQLEQNLKALGYTGFTVDSKYTSDTADAVKDWQDDLNLDETGVVDLGRVLFAPGAIRVDTVKASLGGQIGPGQDVLTYTGTSRIVTVQLGIGDQRLAKKGTAVSVELPDGKKVDGTVQRVYTVIEASDDPNGDPETKIEAQLTLKDAKATAGLDVASVEVVFTAAQHKDVLTVPVAALVALAEGGYGVEIVDGTSTHYVKVETGLFAGGRVEVTGDGITEGVTVGMPK
ncbi:MAG: HlyD family efflux transporter periplasmic adaptor subunit [Hamadaea sp.]|uniref:efflux RND transporter periplasmic adaptor subunit n=1 Tax=Hamadaea sp. TaxID=2024425 RepID=UPI0017E15F39|nr:peptidoglycan-binding domain-containing protein [Hamadaea sp.]NUR71379.1 HlyD family efflux transporter periplasmic adaptor subunit [Hamadaea sp.]NUT22676.1 HlyD family efflux transporter periplasmic adaptor subunit [Hamadaea sp.]